MIIIFIYIANCIESCYVVLYEHKVVAGYEKVKGG